MKGLRLCVAVALAGLCVLGGTRNAAAQVTINIGVAPVCPYGYFNYAPYSCAPFGYYGPKWFLGGVFIGAGPWFHGPEEFHGYVNRDFDPRFGYGGPIPRRDERPDWGKHVGWEKHFRGIEMHEEYRHDNGHHYGQDKDHGHGHGHDDDHGNGHDHDHDRD